MICNLCSKEFSSLSGLHTHLSRTHKVSQKEFYYSFFPRYDLQSGDLIDYKDYKQYHEADFNSRESFSDWLAEHYKEDATKEYCFAKLKERMARKNISEIPCHCALKSLMLPSIYGFERMYGSLEAFEAAIKQAGFKLKFDYSLERILEPGPMKIFMDSREQRPLGFQGVTDKMKLSVGDYVPDKPFYSDVYIDRKSLPDLAGTLVSGRERVEREIQRALDLNFYLIFVIEDSYANTLGYSSDTSFSRKLNGQHIMHEIRGLMEKYNNIQFVFANNRSRAATVIENIFRLKGRAKTADLELLKDRGEI